MVGESGGGAWRGCRAVRAHASHARARIPAAVSAGGVLARRTGACPFGQGRWALTRGPVHCAGF
jgi:hypothetical protein